MLTCFHISPSSLLLVNIPQREKTSRWTHTEGWRVGRAGEKELVGVTHGVWQVEDHRSLTKGAVAKGETEGRDPGHSSKTVSTHPQPVEGSHGAEYGSSVGAREQGSLVLSALGTHSCPGCEEGGSGNSVCYGMFLGVSWVDT